MEEPVRKTIHLKISKGTLQINGEKEIYKAHLKENKPHFNLKLSRKSNEIEVECCNAVENVSHNQQQQQQKRTNGCDQQIDDSSDGQRIQQTQLVRQTKTLSKVMVPTLQSLIESSWTRCKRLQKNANITINSIVMAKMKSYCPWPARILEINQTRTKAKVYFFGSNNEGAVDMKEIVEFTNAAETVRFLLLRKNLSFTNGIRTIESIIGVPDALSIITS